MTSDQASTGEGPTSQQAVSAAQTSQAEGDETAAPAQDHGVVGGQDEVTDEIPNPSTGVGIGAGSEPSTFEPEEDDGSS